MGLFQPQAGNAKVPWAGQRAEAENTTERHNSFTPLSGGEPIWAGRRGRLGSILLLIWGPLGFPPPPELHSPAFAGWGCTATWASVNGLRLFIWL